MADTAAIENQAATKPKDIANTSATKSDATLPKVEQSQSSSNADIAEDATKNQNNNNNNNSNKNNQSQNKNVNKQNNTRSNYNRNNKKEGNFKQHNNNINNNNNNNNNNRYNNNNRNRKGGNNKRRGRNNNYSNNSNNSNNNDNNNNNNNNNNHNNRNNKHRNNGRHNNRGRRNNMVPRGNNFIVNTQFGPNTGKHSQPFFQPPFSFTNQAPHKQVNLLTLCDPVLADEKANIITSCLEFSGSWLKDKFPGTIPAPFDRNKLANITPYRYTFSVKADGIRVLALFKDDNIYFVDRKLDVYQLKSKYFYYDRQIVSENQKGSPFGLANNTLLDGEIVTTIDTSAKEKLKEGESLEEQVNFFFIIFDSLFVSDQSVRHLDLFARVNRASYLLNYFHPLYNCQNMMLFQANAKQAKNSSSKDKKTASATEESAEVVVNTEQTEAEEGAEKSTEEANAPKENDVESTTATETEAPKEVPEEKEVESTDAQKGTESKSEEQQPEPASNEQGSKLKLKALSAKAPEFTPGFTSTVDTKKNGMFRMGIQRYYMLEELERVLHYDALLLHYASDGIIFAPLYEPYKLGHSSLILKWKPHHLNTIDFKISFSFGKQEAVVAEESSENTSATNEKPQPVESNLIIGDGENKVQVFPKVMVAKNDGTIFYDWFMDEEGLTSVIQPELENKEQQEKEAVKLSAEEIVKLADGLIVACWWDPNQATSVPTFKEGANSDDSSQSNPVAITSVSPRKGGWKILKRRSDVAQPNSDWIVRQVANAISEEITPIALLRAFGAKYNA